jgi:hypothetical protein
MRTTTKRWSRTTITEFFAQRITPCRPPSAAGIVSDLRTRAITQPARRTLGATDDFHRARRARRQRNVPTRKPARRTTSMPMRCTHHRRTHPLYGISRRTARHAMGEISRERDPSAEIFSVVFRSSIRRGAGAWLPVSAATDFFSVFDNDDDVLASKARYSNGFKATDRFHANSVWAYGRPYDCGAAVPQASPYRGFSLFGSGRTGLIS